MYKEFWILVMRTVIGVGIENELGIWKVLLQDK